MTIDPTTYSRSLLMTELTRAKSDLHTAVDNVNRTSQILRNYTDKEAELQATVTDLQTALSILREKG